VRALVRDSGRSLSPNFDEIIVGNLSDQDALMRLADGADAFVHNAGAVRAKNRSTFLSVNRDGSTKAARAWRALASPNLPFVLISSLAANLSQISPYAESKAGAEAEITKMLAGRSFAILRPPAIYGPADLATRPFFRALAKGIVPCIGPSDAKFSMIYVQDAASAALAALDAASSVGPVFEIDDGSGGYTWNDIVRAVEGISTGRVRRLSIPNTILTIAGTLGSFAAVTGLSTPFLTRNKAREIMFGDWRVNPARRLPDWRPHTSLEMGFSKTLEWYRAHQ